MRTCWMSFLRSDSRKPLEHWFRTRVCRTSMVEKHRQVRRFLWKLASPVNILYVPKIKSKVLECTYFLPTGTLLLQAILGTLEPMWSSSMRAARCAFEPWEGFVSFCPNCPNGRNFKSPNVIRGSFAQLAATNCWTRFKMFWHCRMQPLIQSLIPLGKKFHRIWIQLWRTFTRILSRHDVAQCKTRFFKCASNVSIFFAALGVLVIKAVMFGRTCKKNTGSQTTWNHNLIGLTHQRLFVRLLKGCLDLADLVAPLGKENGPIAEKHLANHIANAMMIEMTNLFDLKSRLLTQVRPMLFAKMLWDIVPSPLIAMRAKKLWIIHLEKIQLFGN